MGLKDDLVISGLWNWLKDRFSGVGVGRVCEKCSQCAAQREQRVAPFLVPDSCPGLTSNATDDRTLKADLVTFFKIKVQLYFQNQKMNPVSIVGQYVSGYKSSVSGIHFLRAIRKSFSFWEITSYWKTGRRVKRPAYLSAPILLQVI